MQDQTRWKSMQGSELRQWTAAGSVPEAQDLTMRNAEHRAAAVARPLRFLLGAAKQAARLTRAGAQRALTLTAGMGAVRLDHFCESGGPKWERRWRREWRRNLVTIGGEI